MLIRILFLIVLVGLVLFLLKRGNSASSSESNQPSNQKEAQDLEAEQMVPCRYCGVHLPKSEAIGNNDVFFCSEEHQKISKQENRES
ncbi:MAG: PP0621 family protein [Pseudomonadales bacterium]|nr:PP0621 family protein [Pseudomonadales bacterium]